MIDMLRHFLVGSPILALFLVIGTGYALGAVSVFGFSLGVGAVLFTGLAIGALAPAASPPGMVGTLGLLMFLYGIGIQYGEQFFKGLRGDGRRANLLALTAVLTALALTIAAGTFVGIPLKIAMGAFAGSMTSTATLQAAIEAAGSRDPAIGYSVAYPFGVVGPILCFHLLTKAVKPALPPPPPPVSLIEIVIDHPHLEGETAADLERLLPSSVRLMAIRTQHRNILPSPDLVLAKGDVILIAGTATATAAAEAALGHAEPGRITKDRSAYDGREFFVSNSAMVGIALEKLALPRDLDVRIAYVRRGETVLLPNPHLTLEFGDRVTVMAPAPAMESVRKIFGHSLTATAEFSYISLGAGMVLGVLLGLISIPLPGIGKFSLGLAGGPLVMALILGRLGRTGPISWRIPLAANLVMRNFGLTVFLGAVGMSAGQPFVTQIGGTGLPVLLLGMASVLCVVALIFAIGGALLKIRFDDLLGIAAGATGNPAILVFANRLVPSDRPNVGYATIFPSMTIAKIIGVEIVLRLLD